jgi:DNA-binding transcriptional ArsR family regulator
MYVQNPKAFELMGDETRRRMVYLLRAKEMTVAQIADQLQKTPQAIYHHIRKLLESGLIVVAKEERVDHFIETYYRAAAEVFDFSYGEGNTTGLLEQHTRDALQSMRTLGFNVRVSEEDVSRMIDLMKKLNGVEHIPPMQEKIAELEGVDFIGKQEVAKFVNILSMTEKQFEEWIGQYRQVRQLLKSMTTETEIAPKIRKSRQTSIRV